MALSNWLTREEWNAVYFAGVKEAATGKPCESLGEQMRLGIGALHRAGFKFTGITSTADGDYEKVTQCCSGNEEVLAEMITGNFDPMGRAKEVLEWAERTKPPYDWAWLRELVKKAEKKDKEDKK